jgi:hypothetical protein
LTLSSFDHTTSLPDGADVDIIRDRSF